MVITNIDEDERPLFGYLDLAELIDAAKKSPAGPLLITAEQAERLVGVGASSFSGPRREDGTRMWTYELDGVQFIWYNTPRKQGEFL